MQVIFGILATVLVLAFMGYLVYVSVQSLRQGAVLKKALPLHELKDCLDRPVAVNGRPELVDSHSQPYPFDVLWYKQDDQVYRRSGRSSSWRTVSTREKGFDFHLHFPDGGRVRVHSEPTETHGACHRTEKEGFLSRHRTVHRWFPAAPEVTVLGKLVLSGDGATIVRDEKVGMLFSTKPPEKAAAWETVKGIAGIVFAACVAAGGIALLVYMMA